MASSLSPQTKMTISSRAKGGISRWPWILGFILVAVALVSVLLFWGDGEKVLDTQNAPTEKSAAEADKTTDAAKAGTSGTTPTQEERLKVTGDSRVPRPSVHGKILDVTPNAENRLSLEGPAAQEQQERKNFLGLSQSLDAVLRSDESIRIGNKTVSVKELERKLVVEQRGGMVEKPLEEKPKITTWGVYLVRPGENLWDIHFRLLREYMKSRGVPLNDKADRPDEKGFSSGVGKVLKFAEHMVGIFNVKTGHMDSNLNLLEPGHKVVIYNLSEIFDQLAKIDPQDLSGIMYDGRVLLFPEKETSSGKKSAP